MKKLFILLLLLASFSSFSQQKEKDPIIGLDKKDIIAKYGQPTTIKRDGGKGEILIYREHQSWGSASTSDRNNILSPKTDLYTFYLDKKGRVYSWKWRQHPQP